MTTAVITGSTGGFGEALARRLAALGANVVVAGRNSEAAKRIADEIGADRALHCRCDVTSADDVDRLWTAATERFGRVDHWINNAGVANKPATVIAADPDDFRIAFDTNVFGALIGIRRATLGMSAQDGGGHIWLTEGLGCTPRPVFAGTAPYSASKAAASSIFRVLAKESEGTPIRIGFLRPGVMDTGLALGDPDAEMPTDMRRLVDTMVNSPDDVARNFAPRILASTTNGELLNWLTPGRVARKLVTAPLRR